MIPEPRILPWVVGDLEYRMRILEQGTPKENMSDEELKRALFYNKIFHDDLEELIQKHRFEMTVRNMNRLKDLYDRYVVNMWGICCNMLNRNGWRLELDPKNSFERDLACRRLLDTKYEAIGGMARGRTIVRGIKSGQVYYLGWQKYRGDRVPTIIDIRDGEKDFRDPISFIIGDERVYWKTDECIRLVLEKHGVYGATACRFTLDENDQIIKCEFSGDASVPDSMRGFFHQDCLIVPNPFVVIDDLVSIVNRECSTVVEEVQETVDMDADLLRQDKLIEYPKKSFMDSIGFLVNACDNPMTKSIYMTLYRIGNDPTIFYTLRSAILKGINVHVNVELTASGEGVNYFWAKEFKKIGAKVTTFRSGELKVHAKVILVERTDGRYVAQIGTGNYHTKTTKAYTDLAMNTSNQKLCKQIRKLFEVFDGAEDVKFDDCLLVSKFNMRKKIIKMIEEEGRKGSSGYVFIKCNSMDDPEIIQALNTAAWRGAVIDLIVRGSCSWIPDPGILNKRVRIRSFVWDKLEHSRVYAFGSENPKMFIGSADPVHRKISNRIEVLAAVNHSEVREELLEYIDRYIHCKDNSWKMELNILGFPMYVRESQDVPA